MIKKHFGIGMLALAISMIGLVLIPFANAQEENNYNITVEQAFESANANLINFIVADAPGFENWTEATIDPKPLELYDINGQKLFYRFSVYNEKKVIGTIDIRANKTLGPAIYDIVFDPAPYELAEAAKKSKEIAKNKYPTGEIESTTMVVYSYPSIGAMTVIKDKNGIEHRIFVDGYTLNEVQDRPATETEPGVWSMYEIILKNGKENNLKDWEKSANLTKSIEAAVANKGVNINEEVTGDNLKKLSDELVLDSFTGKILNVHGVGQEESVYCVPACILMLCKYYNKPTPIPTQYQIYMGDGLWSWGPGQANTSGLSPNDIVKWASHRWDKTGTSTTTFLDTDVVTEIENNRPFFTLNTDHHSRICRGYICQDGDYYLRINDPKPVGSTYGTPNVLESTCDSSEIRRIYIR